MIRAPAAPRIEWLDAARGLAIGLVVFGHVLRGLEAAGEAASATWVRAVDLGLYSFHMPLFFFLAGLNVASGLSRGRVSFAKDKLWTVVWPYLLWSAVQGSAAVLAGDATNADRGWGDLLRIGWAPIGQFWFLYALAILHGAGLLFGRQPRLLLALSVAAFVVSAMLAPDQGLMRGLLHGALFYAAGVWLGPAVKTWPGGERPAWAVVILCIFMAALWMLGGLAAGDPRSLWLLPCAVAGGAGVMLVSRLLRAAALRCAAIVGRASMTIYVLHILTASGLRIGLHRAGLEAPIAVDLALGTAVGVLAPLGAHWLLEKRDLLWPLGLSRRPSLKTATADGAGGRGRTDTPFGTGF